MKPELAVRFMLLVIGYILFRLAKEYGQLGDRESKLVDALRNECDALRDDLIKFASEEK